MIGSIAPRPISKISDGANAPRTTVRSGNIGASYGSPERTVRDEV
ncbi:hypothetical protein [Georgenia sp. SUBG003]